MTAIEDFPQAIQSHPKLPRDNMSPKGVLLLSDLGALENTNGTAHVLNGLKRVLRHCVSRLSL